MSDPDFPSLRASTVMRGRAPDCHREIGFRILCAVGAIVSLGCSAHLQSAAAPTGSRPSQCDSILGAPTADSALESVALLVLPFDRAQRIDSGYLRLVARGIRESLTVPQPLPLDTYQPTWIAFLPLELPRKSYAVPTLRSFYRVELHRDGRLTRPRPVGGVRIPQFDAAMVSAMVTLDTQRLLPPAREKLPVDSVDLDVVVTPDVVMNARAGKPLPERSDVQDLFALRLPVRVASADVRMRAPAQVPRYPAAMRDAGVEGEVRAEFVVGADGIPDAGSIHFVSATALPFVEATLQVLPEERFMPLAIGGCPVRALIQWPFEFRMP